MTPRHGSMLRSTARWAAFGAIPMISAGGLMQGGCLVTEHCFADSDCTAPKLCAPDGTCQFACSTDDDCGDGMGCVERRCRPRSVQPIACPQDMVNVADAFCVDRYEASRPDATRSNPGSIETRAVSRQGVMPWRLVPPASNAQARAACQTAGKDLCTPHQWRAACEGPQATAYGYGDVYNSATCNGIDTFGLSGFHLLPTGELPGCRSGWGAFDMNGNLWEHVLGGSDQTIRGGAYNCKDSQSSHRCDYVPGDWTPSARGFRCCVVPDASAPDGAVADTSVSDAADAESGCVAEDGSVDAADASDDAADAATDAVDDAPTDAVKDVETGVDACSADMVRIREFCMDRYEASRSDATSTSMGTLFIATSRAGVLPWFPVDLTTARARRRRHRLQLRQQLRPYHLQRDRRDLRLRRRCMRAARHVPVSALFQPGIAGGRRPMRSVLPRDAHRVVPQLS
ncbi:MAG: formylglycine-generating enzyme family protein [Polyangiaceae bacterium]|nr:formylglycine-generating enzyme family protein [Polyangiaceae bacterium]